MPVPPEDQEIQKFQEPASNIPTIRQLRDSAQDEINAMRSNTRDPYRAVKIEGVNLGPTSTGGLNFERYYNKSAYKDLGFNPYKDNESYYNNNSSKWSDIKDAYSQNWNLFGLGFKTVWSDASDREEARDYERYSNIGSTSRGGVFGTLTNAYLNSGYTIGLLAEIAAEELALAAGSVATGGAMAPVAGVETAKNIAQGAAAVKKTFSLTKGLDRMVNRLKDLKNVSNARSIYEGAKSAGKAINPLRGTTDYLRTGKALDKADDISDLAITGKTFGAFYRDIREINLAYDEAKLEKGFVSNGVKDDLILEYKREHGVYPDAEAMQDINGEAEKAADNTLLANSLLIYSTNRLAFGNTFNKYLPQALRKTTADVVGGRIVSNFAKKSKEFIEHGGLLGYKTLVNEAKYAASNLKSMPLATAKFLGKYTRANFGEGMQEYFQEVIQDAEKNKALDRYYGGVAGGAWYNALLTDEYMDAYTESTSKFMSKEGADVFMSGFIMGGFAGPAGRVMQSTSKTLTDKGTYQYFYDKNAWAEGKEQAKTDREDIEEKMKKFNEMTDSKKEFLHNYIDFLSRQVKLKTEQDQASEESNPKKFHNAKDEALVDQILFAEGMGGTDLVIKAIEDLSQLSEEDLKSAFSDNVENIDEFTTDFKTSADDIIKRAKSIVTFSKEFDNLFPEPAPLGYAKDTDPIVGKKRMAHLRQARQQAKREAITNQYSLVRTMERMSSVLKDTYGKDAPFWNKENAPPPSEITKIFNFRDLTIETMLLRDEIKALKGFDKLDPIQKKDLAYKEKALKIFEKLGGEEGGANSYRKGLMQEELIKQVAEEKESLTVGRTIKYKRGNTSWEGEIIGETENNKGQPQWIIEKPETGDRVKVLKTSKGITTNKIDKLLEKDFTKKPTENLRKIFKEYMELLAEQYDSTFNETKLDAAFQNFKDFYSLDADKTNLSETVAFLMSPEGHFAMVERYNEMITRQYENLPERVKAQLELYKEAQGLNKLIQMLALSYNVVIAEDDLVILNDDNIAPDEYYDIDSGEPLSETDGEKFIKIREAIDTWLVEDGRVDKETEVTEEAVDEAPVDEAPTTKQPIDIDETPFEQWDDSIKTIAKNFMNEYNKEVGIEADKFTDVENFVAEFNPGYEKIRSHIKVYNAKLEKAAKEAAPASAPAPAAASTDENLKKQEELENRVKEIDAEIAALRGENGTVPKNKLEEFKRLQKERKEAIAMATRGVILEGEGGIAIQSKPTDPQANPQVLVGSDAKLAETVIEKIISSGIENGRDVETIMNQITAKYHFNVNELGPLQNYIRDRSTPSIPEIGNNKQSFPAWRRGKMDEAPTETALEEAAFDAGPSIVPFEDTQETNIQETAFEIELTDELEASLFGGKREMIAFEPGKEGEELKQIMKGLRDGKLVPRNANFPDLKPDTIVTIYKNLGPNKRRYIQLIYQGYKGYKELDITNDEAAAKFDLPVSTEITPDAFQGKIKVYTHPNSTHRDWFQGKGQLAVFEVSTPIDKKISASEGSIEAWKEEIERLFRQSPLNVDEVREKVENENAIRNAEGRPSLAFSEIAEMYEKAQREVTPDKLVINDEYKVNIYTKIKGESINFGTALVVEVVAGKGVRFESTGKKTIGTRRLIKNEDLAKALRGKVSTDMRAEEIIEKPETTEKEEQLIENSSENEQPLSKEIKDALQAESDTITSAERLKMLKKEREQRCP